MKKITEYCLLLFLVPSFGCLPAQKVTVPALKSVETGGQPPGSAFSGEIEKKIRFLDTLLTEKDLSDSDKEIATNLRDTYQLLGELSSSRHPTETDYSTVTHDLFRCLSTIDKRYFDKKTGAVDDHARTISLFSEKRARIVDSYMSGDFQAVIDSCMELKTIFGPDSLTPDIGLLFALSLARKGMLNEAITIGEGVGRELETNPDIVQLRLGIAEWHLIQGQREKAISLYEKLADTQDEKRMEIQSLSRKIAAAERRGSVIGPIRGRTPSQRVEKMTVDSLLEEVEKLLEENRFSEAKALLLLKEQKAHSTEAETINQAYRRLELAEENYLEEKISMISMNRDMEQARRLLEQERYEEVISRLEALKPEEEDSRDIKELKQFAIEKLINRERNRAAKIFLTAKETQDPARKKECFLQCLGILKALVDEYPLCPLNQKLLSHINIVEEELGKLEMSTEAREISE